MNVRAWLVGLLAVGVLSGAPTPTSARYSTVTTSHSNAFTAGTLHIADTFAANTTLTMDDFLPGDDLNAQLNVANGGSLGLTYSMSSSIGGSPTLASALQLTVSAASTSTCSASDPAAHLLYSGSLDQARFGDFSQGVGDAPRSLGAAATDALCFNVRLPDTATSSVAASSVSASFAFSAQQQS